MRGLKRNQTEFTYTPYIGREEILKNGKHTGKNEKSYGRRVYYVGNISTPSGTAQQTLFGIDTRYTHVLIMYDPEADIRENGLIHWKGDTYEVKAVRPSKNVLSVALMKTIAGEN